MGIEQSKTLIPYNESDENSECVNDGSALYQTAIAKRNVLGRDLCFGFPSLKVTAKDACKVMLPDYKVNLLSLIHISEPTRPY